KAAVLPTAKLLPTKPASGVARPPAAKPVVATPIRVAPVAPIPVAPVRGAAPAPRMRSARREDDDDEFTERSNRKSPVGVLVLVSLLGLLIVGGLTAGIIFLVRSTGGDAADGSKPTARDGYVEPKQLWDPQADPGKPGPGVNNPIPPF